MPHSRLLLSHLFVVAVAAFSLSAHSAEWRECEQAKLRELQLQRNADSHKTSKRKSHRNNDENRRQRAEELDTWLWKNCREFSYELRQIEQDRM